MLPVVVFARNIDNDYFSIEIPDDYKTDGPGVTDKSFSIDFKRSNNNGNSNIFLYSFSFDGTFMGEYTQQDVDNEVKAIKEKYNLNDYYMLESVSGELIELNGARGYKVIYCIKSKTNGEKRRQEKYDIRTDRKRYYFTITSKNDNLSLSEIAQIVESFKVKDTVIKHFIDVSESAWYYKAIDYVYKNNIIKGTGSTTFAPNDKLTRGMMVTILYRMEGEPKVTGTPKFPDVQDSSKYYYKAVKWATDKGIVSGYDNGKFGPNDNIQRQQLAVILNKYAKYKEKDVSAINNLEEFTDKNKISSYAINQMKWAVGAEVISGNEDKVTGEKTLNPKGNATRAEAAAMLEKYCKNVGR